MRFSRWDSGLRTLLGLCQVYASSAYYAISATPMSGTATTTSLELRTRAHAGSRIASCSVDNIAVRIEEMFALYCGMPALLLCVNAE